MASTTPTIKILENTVVVPNRLVFNISGNVISTPYSFTVRESENPEFHIKGHHLEVLDFKFRFEEAFNENTGEGFNDPDELFELLLNYMGFKTAVGGSTAEPVSVPSALQLKTGANYSFHPWDDGYTQRGFGASFSQMTPGTYNGFGNSLRFTDITGGEIFTPTGIVIDWFFQIPNHVWCWNKNPVAQNMLGHLPNWEEAFLGLDFPNGAGTVDWRLPNVNELATINDFGSIYGNGLEYPAFYSHAGQIIWSSTSHRLSDSMAFVLLPNNQGIHLKDKMEQASVIACGWVPLNLIGL